MITVPNSIPILSTLLSALTLSQYPSVRLSPNAVPDMPRSLDTGEAVQLIGNGIEDTCKTNQSLTELVSKCNSSWYFRDSKENVCSLARSTLPQ